MKPMATAGFVVKLRPKREREIIAAVKDARLARDRAMRAVRSAERYVEQAVVALVECSARLHAAEDLALGRYVSAERVAEDRRR